MYFIMQTSRSLKEAFDPDSTRVWQELLLDLVLH